MQWWLVAPQQLLHGICVADKLHWPSSNLALVRVTQLSKIFIDRGHRLSYFCRISYHICLHSSTDFSVQISSDFSKSLWPLWYEWWVSQVHLALKINCHLSVACDKFWTISVQIMQMTMIQGRKFDKRYSPFSITSSYHKATFCVQDDAPSGRMICRGLLGYTLQCYS